MIETFVFCPGSATSKRYNSLPVWTGDNGSTEMEFEASILKQLKEIRQDTKEHLEDLIEQLKKVCNKSAGVTVVEAIDAARAAEIVSEVTPERKICVNKSSTIKEIKPLLEKNDFTIVEAYEHEYSNKESDELKSWQFPDIQLSAIWNAFSKDKYTIDDIHKESNYKDITGVFGVNAVACTDGSVYFLQHFSNITKMLRHCKRLIFLVSIEKIVRRPEDASLQAIATGLFGYKSRIMDLASTEGGGTNIWDQLPDIKTARECYFILLDNGRRDNWIDEFSDLFLCIGCRSCRQNCPTYSFYDAPSPKEYLNSFLLGTNDSLSECGYCRGCFVKCPVGINIPHMISTAKGEKTTKLPFYAKELAATRVEDIGRIASRTAPVSNLLLKSSLIKRLIEMPTGIAHQRTIPHFYNQTFASWFISRQGLRSENKIGFFPGCFVNYNDVDVGKAFVHVLEKAGYEVILPPQHCCNTPRISMGDFERAKPYVSYNISSLYNNVVSQGYPVLVTCPSCAGTLEEDSSWILGESRAREVSENVIHFGSFLLELVNSGQLELGSSAQEFRAGYHMPCHTKSLSNPTSTLELLKKIPGMEVSFIDRGCCGMLGSFGLKKRNYDKSMEIGSDLFTALGDNSIDFGITECGVCKMQMVYGSGKRVFHPLQLLSKSVDYENWLLNSDGGI